MDNRIPLPKNYPLKSQSRTYFIERYISSGSNSMVYQAWYQDTLMPEHTHLVLVKELYPFDGYHRIDRDEQMGLVISQEAKNFFAEHKASFLLGNQAHLLLSAEGKGHIAENLDSFEANNTLYTVLSARKGEVFSKMKEMESVPTLTDAAACFRSLLYALKPFHSNGLLHLDVSPDNLFLLQADEESAFPTEVLLLDFNSVYSMDKKLLNDCQYYLGKQNYMAPEVRMHQENALGPWTDIYSACAVFYEMLTGEDFPKDRELLDTRELVSPYSRLLLHEKESAAKRVNRILEKGLQMLPENRYRDVSEVLADLTELQDILSGALRIPVKEESEGEGPEERRKPRTAGWKKAAAAIAFMAAGALIAVPVTRLYLNRPLENTQLDLTQFPLETDDSVVLTEHDVRYPLKDGILTMQVKAESAVRAMLKDYDHIHNESDIFQTYSLFTFYCGQEDKRGWQNAGLTYDFFTTEDNRLHMVLPFQDANAFDLDYIGVVFQNFNYTETAAILDIETCRLTDGAGNSHDLTDLIGSHLLFFDEDRFQQNLMTTQPREFVTSFEEMYGGELVVDARVCFLEPVLEVTWESEDPKIASVDDRGRIKGVSQGWTRLTGTFTDKETGETRKTQMMVNVTAQP
ncbi:MAG: Ig-like domain-containing protein [Eubacteriales bacterium]|nr:Ig-like domain-containing protein [Eubacteriales bacterium]